jgi:predicted dienelactone hydrolase
MMRRHAILLLAAILAACGGAPPPAGPEKVGVTALLVTDTKRQRPLDVQVWYPASPEAVETRQAYERAFQGWAASDGPYHEGPKRPLILLSHGTRGANLNQSWLAEALAANGYIVAAPTHYGDTRLKNSPEATVRAWERPQDLSFALTSLLADSTWGPRIDVARVGAAGHSSGGYTVLALAGARYNPFQMDAYCRGPQAGPDCRFAMQANFASIDFTHAGDSYRDERVRAVVAFAPAIGPGMTDESLRAIATPVLIIAARDDEVLPFEQHAARYAREVPAAVLQALPEGGHMVFMPECNVVGWVFTWLNPFDICGREHPNVDRGAAHRQMIRDALKFFGDKLRPATPPAID